MITGDNWCAYAASHFGARVRISDAIYNEGSNSCPAKRPADACDLKSPTLKLKCDAESTPSGRNRKLPTLCMLGSLVNYKGIEASNSKFVVNYDGRNIHSETV